MTETNVPRLRFRKFDDEWNSEKLGELSDIVRGASPRPIKDKRWFSDTSEIGWIRISDVTSQNGKIRELAQHLSEEGQKKTRVLKSPHLLLSIAASVGKPVINYVPTGVHDGFLIFKNPKFNINYMYSYLDYFQNQWNKFGQPGSQVNLNSDLVKSLILYLPNKDEQDKISVFVSKMDKLIELQTQKLEQLKKLKQGYLQKMFPQDGEYVPRLRFSGFSEEWENQGLLNLAKLRTGSRNAEDGIDDGKFIFFDRSSEIKFLNEYDFDGEVIVYAGEGAKFLPRKFNGKYSLHQRAYGIYDFKNINFEFLYQELLNKNNHFLKYAVGTTAKSLRKDCFEKLIINYPSVDEQRKIGKFLSELDQMINNQSDKIESLKQQKKAYLQKMFI
ncbi:restriction endonuclease subunit S [Apilactobacillus kunkeei]|nr:restriction endonuclease subunit S [Apilactobacillus kunkeei]